MNVFKRLMVIQILLLSLVAHANDSLAVHFTFDKKRTDDKQVIVDIKAVVPNGAELFALQRSTGDTLYSSIEFDSACKKYLEGPVNEIGNIKTGKDSALNASVNYFTDSVTWQQQLKIPASDSILLKGKISYML